MTSFEASKAKEFSFIVKSSNINNHYLNIKKLIYNRISKTKDYNKLKNNQNTSSSHLSSLARSNSLNLKKKKDDLQISKGKN